MLHLFGHNCLAGNYYQILSVPSNFDLLKNVETSDVYCLTFPLNGTTFGDPFGDFIQDQTEVNEIELKCLMQRGRERGVDRSRLGRAQVAEEGLKD